MRGSSKFPEEAAIALQLVCQSRAVDIPRRSETEARRGIILRFTKHFQFENGSSLGEPRPLLSGRSSFSGDKWVKREIVDRLPRWVRVLHELAEQSDLKRPSVSRRGRVRRASS